MPVPRIKVALPDEVEALVTALGMHAVKIGLLGLLARTPEMRSPQLAAQLGISTQMASHHLLELERSGLVTADRRPPRRGREGISWVLNRDALRAELDGLALHVLGPEG